MHVRMKKVTLYVPFGLQKHLYKRGPTAIVQIKYINTSSEGVIVLQRRSLSSEKVFILRESLYPQRRSLAPVNRKTVEFVLCSTYFHFCIGKKQFLANHIKNRLRATCCHVDLLNKCSKHSVYFRSKYA